MSSPVVQPSSMVTPNPGEKQKVVGVVTLVEKLGTASSDEFVTPMNTDTKGSESEQKGGWVPATKIVKFPI